MSEHPVRDIGRVADLYGAYVTVGVDHDAVTIDGPKGITLGPDERDDFVKLFMQADGDSKAWAEACAACAECKGTGMVDGDGSCNCGSPADISVGYSHERYCGAEPCPAGCPVPAVMPAVSG